MFLVHRKSAISLTEQICQQIADRIQSGLLEPGSRLPSVRELSERLHVSLVTVVQAYTRLEHEGFVRRIHGKGTFVAGTAGTANADQTAAPNPYDWQLALTDHLPRASVLTAYGRRSTSMDIPYRMAMASIHPDLTHPSPLAEAKLIEVVRQVTDYGPVEGLASLRSTVAAYLRESGLHSRKEDLLITNGVQQAIDLVARTFVGAGDVVVVEAPTYSGAIDVFRARGAALISIPMDQEGIRTDLLMKQCDHAPPKLIYTMPTFHNPTGKVMSARRRAELLELAETYHFLILEDDSFSECSFVDRVPPPIRAFDTTGHVIYVKGFSKVFCAGCRIAAIDSSGSIYNRLLAAKCVTDLGSPTLTQALLQAMMQAVDGKQRMASIVRAVQQKRDIALNVLKRKAPPGVRWSVPDGGFNLWLTLPSHVNTDVLLIQALQEGVSFLPGSACYADSTTHHQLRISFAGLDDSTLRTGVEHLCDLLVKAVGAEGDRHLPVV